MPASIVLGLFFVLGMYIFGNYILQTRKSEQYVSVKGLAEKEVFADLGSWMIVASQADNNLGQLKQSLNNQMASIEGWLMEKGFEKGEIKVEEFGIRENIYGQTQARYTASLQVLLTTGNVEALDRCSGQINELLDRGVSITGDRWETRPRYFFTRINDIKPELLREATKAALVSAEEFAQNADASVGGIRRARQGIISLIPHSRVNDAEEFYRHKIARVVSSIDYYID